MLATLAIALLSLKNAPYLGAAPLQMGPALAILLGLLLALPRWPMPMSSVACICAFLVLHTIGARYIYSYVPYDGWFVALGMPSPSEVFGWERNHFDRLVHFSFGALFTLPIVTFLHRHWCISVGRASYIAVEFIIAVSALYEIFEWMLTLFMASADAEAYNGQQGDFWDAQKDMALAALGALITGAMCFLRTERSTD